MIKFSLNAARRSLAVAGNCAGKHRHCALAIGALALAGCGTGAGTGANATAASHSSSTHLRPTLTSAHGAPASFSVLSMSFISDERGYALGTVKCTAGRCVSLLTTSDGGAHWSQLSAPTQQAGITADICPTHQPCVSQIRFATPSIGYAFGPSLFVTTDGGTHWRQLRGPSVTSLEVADGTAIRVASKGRGCGGQAYKVQSAPIGTNTWHLVSAPSVARICPPTLYRQGEQLALVDYGNPAGGVRSTAAIVVSGNSGSTWKVVPDKCGKKDGYAAQVTIAPPDVLVLLCRHQQPNSHGGFGSPWVRVSTNGGATFGPDRTVVAAHEVSTGVVNGYQVAAASATRLVVVSTSDHGNKTYVSQNGGQTWKIAFHAQGSGAIILVGFQDPLTGADRSGRPGLDDHQWRQALERRSVQEVDR